MSCTMVKGFCHSVLWGQKIIGAESDVAFIEQWGLGRQRWGPNAWVFIPSIANMLSLCPLVSRLSLATRTGATRILKGKTIPVLVNSGIEANRISSNSDLSKEDTEVLIEWSFTNKESNAFLGGRHGKLVTVEVNSQLLEVPSGVLPSSINESDKEEMYRLHMEDEEFYTPEKLAKVYNTAAETVAEILCLRDTLKNRKLENREMDEMYRLNKENPEIYTIERLAKDFKFAQGTAHFALFIRHMLENPPWRK
ncbi:hypothetical protein Dsin_018863 [Dipteronia sinensis]|uniref:Uncharacterized protein n=1 Tax=Dipteronia sinensis TaxID=43782 RepID=A0AAE0A6N6_9ROSI|nr:hypothetical protein Dsin_018863 [Dipteronia sinensis]